MKKNRVQNYLSTFLHINMNYVSMYHSYRNRILYYILVYVQKKMREYAFFHSNIEWKIANEINFVDFIYLFFFPFGVYFMGRVVMKWHHNIHYHIKIIANIFDNKTIILTIFHDENYQELKRILFKIHKLEMKKKLSKQNRVWNLKMLFNLSFSVFKFQAKECAVHIKVYRLNVNKNFNYFGMPNCAITCAWAHLCTHIHASPHIHTILFLWFYVK